MQVGIPGGLLFSVYEEGIRGFFGSLEEEGFLTTRYSTTSTPEILEYGLHNCVDEACLPIKLFHGHVRKLQEECDYVVIPRLMKCECGSVICPKFAGLPEMVKSGTGNDLCAFTEPIYLNNPKNLSRGLRIGGRKIGIPDEGIKKALVKGRKALIEKRSTDNHKKISNEWSEKLRVAVLGHSYNLNDPFLNRNIKDKLERLGITVVFGDVTYRNNMLYKRNLKKEGLIKEPYWLSFRENFGAAAIIADSGNVDGVIYLSSFCCGTDSFIIEMVKKKLDGLPFLILKLDEHTGEAGLITRLEAFGELLERRCSNENNLSSSR